MSAVGPPSFGQLPPPNAPSELHIVGGISEQEDLHRKLRALSAVVESAQAPEFSVALVEQGGLQPLLHFYGSTHPSVRNAAAEALAILARQQPNQLELAMEDNLPQLVVPYLTGDVAFQVAPGALI